MKQDLLEQFIQENRAEFDDALAPDRAWAVIETRLKKPAKRRTLGWKHLAVAATALVLVMSGVIAGLFLNDKGAIDSPAYIEFVEAEQYFNNEYARKKSQLASFDHDPALAKDLEDLDDVYQELSKELLSGNYDNTDEVLNALILNYQTRIDLLERVLNTIEENHSQIELNPDDHENTTKL